MRKLRISQVLRTLLAERGLSVRQLSKETGIPQSTLSSYLAGRALSNPLQVSAVAQYLGVSLDYLLFGEEPLASSLESILTEEVFSGWLKVKVERAIPTKRRNGSKEE